jgi:hypothetical protein
VFRSGFRYVFGTCLGESRARDFWTVGIAALATGDVTFVVKSDIGNLVTKLSAASVKRTIA